MDDADWGDVETLLDAAEPDDSGDEAGAEMERTPANTCAQCRLRRLRWSRDGSGIVCSNCGAFVPQPRVQITYEDIVRTRCQFSAVPHLQVVPFNVERAVKYALSGAVRAALHAKMASNVAREMAKKAQRNLNVAGLRYMRRHLVATDAQLAYLAESVYEHLYGQTAAEAVKILRGFLVDGASRAWNDVPRYPWMCALLYPDEVGGELLALLEEHVKRYASKPMKALSENEKRMERMRKRDEPPMDPDRMSADAEPVAYPAPKRALVLSSAYSRLARWRPGAHQNAGAADEDSE